MLVPARTGRLQAYREATRDSQERGLMRWTQSRTIYVDRTGNELGSICWIADSMEWEACAFCIVGSYPTAVEARVAVEHAVFKGRIIDLAYQRAVPQRHVRHACGRCYRHGHNKRSCSFDPTPGVC